MENRENIVKLALDLTHKRVAGNYSAQESSDTLRQALIDANGGSTKFNLKAMRRNKAEIFEILEEIIPAMIQEGLKGDEFFMTLVDEKNVALGDSITFFADDNTNFVVSQIADGIAKPRRQRIGQKTEVTVAPTWHAIRIYEEWSRFMAGRIDWNELIEKVTAAFKNAIYSDVYAALSGVTATSKGFNNTYVKAGTYSEEELLALVDHVEAATGKKAYIIGTKPALRKCTSAVVSDEAKTAYYNGGYYGKLAGVDMIAVMNAHKPGTDEFIVPDDTLYIIASDDKPIKLVREGDAYINEISDGATNADMTVEYTYMEKYGVGIIAAGRMGKYTIS